MNSLLQGLLPFLKGSDNRLVDEQLIQKIQVQLFKLTTFHPDTRLRDDSELVNNLSELLVTLNGLESRKLTPSFAHHISRLQKAIYTALEPMVEAKESIELKAELDDFVEQLRQLKRHQKFSFRSSIALFITLSPLLGYVMYQSFVQLNHGAVLDEVDFIYPEQYLTSETEGAYGFKPEVLEEQLQRFREYYFARTLDIHGVLNPLPNLYRASVTSELNERFSAGANLLTSLELLNVYPDENNSDRNNLAIFRLFLRNLQPHHLLKRIRVTAVRVTPEIFPWHRLDVTASTEASMTVLTGSGMPDGEGFSDINSPLLAFNFKAVNSPVTDFQVNYTLLTSEPSLTAHANSTLDYLTTDAGFRPQFDRSILHKWSENWLLLQFQASDFAELGFPPEASRSLEALTEEVRQVQDANALFSDLPIRWTRCPDGSLIVLSSHKRIQSLFSVKDVTEVEVKQTFLQLDGKRIYLTESMQSPKPLLVTTVTATNHYFPLEQCLGKELLEMVEHYEPRPTAANVLKPIMYETIARFLMGEPLTRPTKIAVEKTLLFDFSMGSELQSKSLDDVVIIDTDQYAQLNIVMRHFTGGVYRLTLYMDEVEVSTVDVDLLWPQSLTYREGDEIYFRETPSDE